MSVPRRADEVALWAAFGVSGEPHRWPRDAAAALGIPPERVEYLCEKWAARGVYDYGTTPALGWKLRPDLT